MTRRYLTCKLRALVNRFAELSRMLPSCLRIQQKCQVSSQVFRQSSASRVVFGIEGSLVGVPPLGFRVKGSWFRVQGSGFRVQGFEGSRFKVWESRVQNAGVVA